MKTLTRFLFFAIGYTLSSAGYWSEWQDFGPCIPRRSIERHRIVDFQDGRQSRHRFCLGDEEADDAVANERDGIIVVFEGERNSRCEDGHKETETRFCRIDTEWSPWQDQGECSEECGLGFKSWGRVCRLGNETVSDPGQDSSCVLFEVENKTTPCIIKPCPVHGGWSPWSEFSPCGSPHCVFPKKTDIQGVQFRTRTCSNPYPQHGGDMCQGPFVQNGTCIDPHNCPNDGGWSRWSNFTCHSNYMTRRRECDNPPARNGGIYCKGKTHQNITITDNKKSFLRKCGHILQHGVV